MAQHRASRQRIFRSAMKHKEAADMLVNSLTELMTNIAIARAKVAADTNLTWDTNYIATAGVSAIDFDTATLGQHKAPARRILRSTLSHKKFADEVADIIEESQVTLNLILAQMDADAGTLSADSVYEAFRISSLLDADEETWGAQHKRSLRQVAQNRLSHKSEGSWLSDSLMSIQSELNSLIDDIQAAN